MKRFQTDVLVVGAGFAGAVAAIRAAEQGANVCIVSEDVIFSGSSFCAGAWGFGLMGPEDQADEDSFARQIKLVGMDMSNESMVDYLVSHVLDEVADLERLGLKLTEPVNRLTEREYIPCFDVKPRSWFLFLKRQVRDALEKQFQRLGITQLPKTEILRLCKENGAVVGALAIHQSQLVQFHCKSVILASGGLGPLYHYRCGNEGLSVLGHALALDAGARLSNLEFLQMIPGFLSPHFRTLCNERSFRFSRFFSYETGEPLMNPEEGIDWARALDQRSTHGPFSTRLYSRHVDICLYEAFRQNGKGVRMRYDETIKTHPSEFSDHYFEWLRREKGLGFDDEVIIGTFYHASNGGIVIDTAGSAGVPGLYACGEATCGMHGADRIGGMSMANGLVFGSAAGRSAGTYAGTPSSGTSGEWLDFVLPDVDSELTRILELTFQHMMVVRDEAGLTQVLEELAAMETRLRRNRRPYHPEPTVSPAYRGTAQLLSMIPVAQAAAQSMLLRRESRGSHYRSDYPETDPQLAQPIVIRRETDTLSVRFQPFKTETR